VFVAPQGKSLRRRIAHIKLQVGAAVHQVAVEEAGEGQSHRLPRGVVGEVERDVERRIGEGGAGASIRLEKGHGGSILRTAGVLHGRDAGRIDAARQALVGGHGGVERRTVRPRDEISARRGGDGEGEQGGRQERGKVPHGWWSFLVKRASGG